MTMLGFDTASIVTPDQARKLADLGYEFACRYYRRSLSGRWTISHEEARGLCDAGLCLVSVFEGGRETTQPGYYTAANGAIDGVAALAKARQMRQPHSSAIYFAVDTDITGETVDGVLEYFGAVEHEFRDAPWGIGVYGDDLVCDRVMNGDLAVFAWLTNARGWMTNKDYDGWHIKQITMPVTVLPGLQIDKNEARGFSEAGMWCFA